MSRNASPLFAPPDKLQPPYPHVGHHLPVPPLEGPLFAAITLSILTFCAVWVRELMDFDGRKNMAGEAAYVLVLLTVYAGNVVAYSILLYRWWACLPPGWRQTTPGKAVGFSFIPGFCFYWWFVALGGLARDLNYFMDSHGVGGERRAPVVLAYVNVILSILGLLTFMIPYLPHILSIVGLIVYLALTVSMTRACRCVLAAPLPA